MLVVDWLRRLPGIETGTLTTRYWQGRFKSMLATKIKGVEFSGIEMESLTALNFGHKYCYCVNLEIE